MEVVKQKYSPNYSFERFEEFEELYFGLVPEDQRQQVQNGEIQFKLDTAVARDKKFIQKMIGIFTSLDVDKTDISEVFEVWREVKPTLTKKLAEFILLRLDVLFSVTDSNPVDQQSQASKSEA